MSPWIFFPVSLATLLKSLWSVLRSLSEDIYRACLETFNNLHWRLNPSTTRDYPYLETSSKWSKFLYTMIVLSLKSLWRLPPILFGNFLSVSLKTSSQSLWGLPPRIFGNFLPVSLETSSQYLWRLPPRLFGDFLQVSLETSFQSLWRLPPSLLEDMPKSLLKHIPNSPCFFKPIHYPETFFKSLRLYPNVSHHFLKFLWKVSWSVS